MISPLVLKHRKTMFVDILHMSVVLVISLFCSSSILHSACENITICLSTPAR